MKFIIEKNEMARAMVQQLSLDKAIAQICCSHYGKNQKIGGDYIETGSVFFHPETSKVLREAIQSYKSICDIEPLITTDLEEGAGRMILDATQFPSFAGICATESEEMVYEVGRVAAIEGRNVGYNWTLAPCVDVLGNPDAPAVTTRSAGRSVEKVIAYSKSYINACQDHGLIATAKHFPGDGFGTYDQHLTTPKIPLIKDEWDRTAGRVYREVIDGGVMSIMPGHLSFPAYDEVYDKNQLYPPATISKKLMVDLLRGELGFEGLIVSDAVDMGGFAGFTNKYDACAMFWEHGGDVLLFANPDGLFLEEIKKRIREGILSEQTIYERAERVLALKLQLGLIGDRKDTPFTRTYEMDKMVHQKKADEVIEKSIQIVRDRESYLPIKSPKQKKILHLILASPTTSEDARKPIDLLSQKLSTMCHILDVKEDIGPQKLEEIVLHKEYDYIICSVASMYQFGTNVIRFHGNVARNLMGGWMHLGAPVVFISHFHHYLHREYEAVMNCVINTHGTKERTVDFLCNVLFE